MRLSLRRVVSAAAGACLVAAAGCSNNPTYPKERVEEGLRQLCANEHLNASVRFVDHTVAVQLRYPGSLVQHGNQIGIGPEFDDAARKAIQSIHRVVLSTNADVRFYVVLISDPNTPGAYLTMVRYLDDVKRANANMLDTPEMYARTVFELNASGPQPLTLEQYVPRDIRMEEFLSWQLARRIQSALLDTLQTSGTAVVGRCGGEFANGQFVFTLNVSPSTERALDEATMQRIFQTSSNVIAKVLSSYKFQSFDMVRLIHPATGRNLVLPKTRLDLFR